MPGKDSSGSSLSRQATLDGVFLPPLPRVRSSEGHIFEWDRSKIIAQIEKETKLVEDFYGYAGATPEQAGEIAKEVEERIRKLGLRSLSGPLIREIVNMTFLEKGMVQYRNVCTRVGTPVFDAHLIDVGRGFEAHDNANLQENAETSHKKKADKISKEQYLLQLPPELADRHLAGDLHVHDLEYFGTRPFCLDGSTVVPFRVSGRHLTMRLDELPLDGDAYLPADLAVLTPQGYRAVQKVTRRPVKEGETLRIRTATGKTLRATREHRIPVLADGTMQITKAGEVQEGDLLYGPDETLSLRGESVDTVDLVRELSASVPPEYLETVSVRGARSLFDKLSEIEGSYTGISRALGIEHHGEWFTRGTMPLTVFRKLCDHYGIADYGDLTVGVAGSEHDLPAVLPVTPALCRLLGFFVSEGNYDVVPGSTYNLAITENHQSEAVVADVRAVLGGYATLSGGTPDVTEIHGVRVEHDRAMQVYFGGKLGYLLFRYVFAIPEGAAKKRLPWLVWHLDDALLTEFLSALFTGDGSAYYRPEKSDCIVNYTTVSASLRQELSLLLSSLGMHPQVVELYAEEDRTTLYRLQINGSANIRTFAKWARFLDDRQEHVDRFCAGVNPIARTPRGEEVVAIGEVAPSGEYVYDLFLDGDGSEESHTFYASDGLLVHNCQDWDLRYFFYYGLMPDGNGTKASVAGPAKRAEVAVLHAVKALGSAQTNFAGGQGYYNFLTFLSPYIEGMEYGEMKQLMQMFVYEMTQMMVARGGQLVFSSVQLSPGVPTLWRDKPCVYKGKVWDGTQAPLRTYGEFEREVRLLFKALIEVMLEGDYWGKPFSFPKPEISIEPDFMEEDEEFNRRHPDLPTYRDLYLLTFELASKFGTPYYDNQLPPYRGAGKGISCYQCCAYQFSSTIEKDVSFEDKLYFRDAKHFSMGSWQVVSVNCPRAAYRAEGDDERLFAELKALMDVAAEVFQIKRRWMETIRTNGRMPFAMQRPKDPNTGERGAVAVDLDSLVYTIGVVGVNEMVQHHTGQQIHESKKAFKLAVRAMTEMELHAREISEKTGMTLALARTPAETTGQRFAVADMLDDHFREAALAVMQGDVETAVADCGNTRDLPVYYTNGTHVAPGADVPLTKRMEIEHVFFPIVDGGNIFHIWLGEARPDPRGLYDMAMNLCQKTQIGYFAFTRDLTVSLKRFREYHGEPLTKGKLGV
ncbi:MAG: anaerobic ribonucleoside-triphosphate reductase [Methanofollis sp.]|uniref:anaerobic ribonucleoside-triphosphate reductase n=1 Tax=Methanofollis sp. TaxID=2052835 RepID=UPI00262E95D2|nr:anaerobic ribonucleoside-triphosphate reductase [Methanofollis sp.]MDD4253905.1 anaerobic ribonucleoside-triphosphate reductase [Methanofollis sp.]